MNVIPSSCDNCCSSRLLELIGADHMEEHFFVMSFEGAEMS